MDEVRNKSLSRRTLVGSAAIGAGAAAMSGQAASGSGASQIQDRRILAQGGNLPTPREQTFVVEQSPNNVWDSFNPFIPNGEAYNYGLAIVCREYLFYTNLLTGEIRPWLATEYSYNADFTEVTLKLNPKAKWSDGQPYTSADVVFTQQLLLDNPSLSGANGLAEDIKAIAAPDPQTVVWTLNAANPKFHYRFLAGIISDGLRVMPKHIWEAQDPGTFRFNPPIQTGPYVLQEASSSKLYYLWKKNPNYWNIEELNAAPEYVYVVQATSPDTSLQEFVQGNSDVPALDFLNQEVAAAQFPTTARFNFPDPCPRGFYFNTESPSGLFATPEGRWAMSHLIDRETIAQTIWQPPSRGATYPWADYPAWQPWAPAEITGKYDFSFNVDKANQLLDGLGATERDGDTRVLNGAPLRLTAITPATTTLPEYQIGVSFANTAREAGIEIEMRSLPGSAFGDAFATGQYDLSCHWICGMSFDPNQLYGWFHSRNYTPIGERTASGNDVRLQSPELDALIEQLDVADPEDPANKPLFDRALDQFLTELPAVQSIQTIYPVMQNTAYWTGWPTEDNPYAIPCCWWGQFLFVIGALQPASGG